MPATVQVHCENKSCRKPFTARVADRKRGWGRFCSKSCKAVRQEQRTGQYRAYLDRVEQRGRDGWHEAGLAAMEWGWDGHKNVGP